MISREDIEAAARRIDTHIRHTPCIELEAGAFGVNASLVLKLETLQHTGSFKPRGAFNRILSNPIPPAGVIAASGGNHGAAVAYAAQQLGLTAEIFVPATTPAIKVARLHSYEARVSQIGQDYAEAYAASQARAQTSGALVVHAYDQPEVVAGQGTIARELETQARDLDSVLVAVGGGGLIGGIAAWFRGEVRVIGVESEGTPTLARALEAGEPVEVNVSGVATDSLGARRIGHIAFDIAQKFVERVVLVSDDDIKRTQQLLWERLRIIAEPGGSAALAALASGRYRPSPGERIGVFVCGANTDPGKMHD